MKCLYTVILVCTLCIILSFEGVSTKLRGSKVARPFQRIRSNDYHNQHANCIRAKYSQTRLFRCKAETAVTCHKIGCCWFKSSLQGPGCFYDPFSEPKPTIHKRTECVVESEDKVWCGENDETSCLVADCCWADDPGYPYCYEKAGTAPIPECSVASEDKIACNSVDEANCTTEGCCWEDDPGYPYCFQKAIGSNSTTASPTSPPMNLTSISTTTTTTTPSYNITTTTTTPASLPMNLTSISNTTTTTTPSYNITTTTTTPGPTPPPGEVCAVANDNKITCSLTATNQVDCERYSCCWAPDEGTPVSLWCHENNVERPPEYVLQMAGDFTSVNGDPFSASCVFSLNQEVSEKAQEMVPEINSRIGVDICTSSNLDDLLATSSSASLSAVVSEGTAAISFLMRTGVNQLISDVESCAFEIFQYVREMSNWPQPILPDIAGCPRAAFTGNQFNNTGSEWRCESGSESRLLGYRSSLLGNATTDDNSDLTADCAQSYGADLNDRANELVDEVNSIVGVLLCVNTPGLSIVSATATLFANGNLVSTSSVFFMRPALSMPFDDVTSCAAEISQYLRDYGVWGDPVLPGQPGCPGLVFPGEQFTPGSEDWACF